MAALFEGDIPQPLQSIGCQDLLKTDNSYSGWLRKRHFVNKMEIFNWPQVYVILSKGCIYYFKNEYYKNALGKFSLYGYNSVTRSKAIAPKQGPWAFQIEHTHKNEFKTYYFAAPSEREMKEWMKHVKGTLVQANGKTSDYYYTYKKAVQETKEKQADDESITYHEIETNIYGDSPSFVIDKDYKRKFSVKAKNDESDEEDEAPPPPPVRPNDLPRLHDRLHDLHDRLNDRPPQPLPTTSPTVPSSRSARDRELPGIPNNTSNTRAAHSVPQNTNTLPSRGQLPDPPDDDPPTVPPRREVNQEPKSKSGHNAKHKKDSKDATDGRGPETTPTNGYCKAKQKARREPEPEPQREPEPEPEDDGADGSYWDDIHFHSSDSDKASEIIRKLEEDGTFLVRDGNKGKVLVVYAEGNLKKYQIHTDENNKFFLKKDGPHSDSLEELMYEYHSVNLPNTGTTLLRPYLHHPRCKDVM